jgi:predicted 2-oxoglutarate/Fe(II)-dependent dioxygenase YbiX
LQPPNLVDAALSTPPSGGCLPLGFASGDPDERARVATLAVLAQSCDGGGVDMRSQRAFETFVSIARPPPPVLALGAADSQLRMRVADAAPVCVRSLLSAHEMATLLAAAAAHFDAAHGPTVLRCEGAQIHTGAAHRTLYLHHDGWLARSFPSLCERLIGVMTATLAAWAADARSAHVHVGPGADEAATTAGVEETYAPAAAPAAMPAAMPNAAPVPLALRCAELHSYGVGGSLSRPGHRDAGSCVSLSVLLSEPGVEHTGGAFVMWEGGDGQQQPVEHTEVRRGDGVVFASHRVHNVAPVLWGERRSLVLELWEGPPLTNGRGVDMVMEVADMCNAGRDA